MMERNPRDQQRWMLAAILASGAGLAAVVWLIASSGQRAEAQQPAQIQVIPGRGLVQFGGRRLPSQMQADGDDSPEGVFLPADRDTTRKWERAKSLLDDGHYTDAITLLDEILQSGED